MTKKTLATKTNGHTSKFPALDPNSDVAAAMKENLQGTGEQLSLGDLVHVSTPPGGSTTWSYESITGQVSTDEIRGLLVLIQPAGVLWPSDEPTEGTKPLLVTYDMEHAVRVGDDFGDIDPDELDKFELDDGTYDWQNLPWTQFGTGKGGHGKRAEESRMLFIVPEGEAWPLVVNAKPGSLKTIRKFVKQLTHPFYRCIVGLLLREAKSQAGIKYSQIQPRLIEVIDEATGKQVKKLYTEPLRQSLVLRSPTGS